MSQFTIRPSSQEPVRITIPRQTDTRPLTVPRIGYSTTEAAEAIGVSSQTVRLLVHQKKIHATPVGKRLIISVQSLHEFIDGKERAKRRTRKSPATQVDK